MPSRDGDLAIDGRRLEGSPCAASPAVDGPLPDPRRGAGPVARARLGRVAAARFGRKRGRFGAQRRSRMHRPPALRSPGRPCRPMGRGGPCAPVRASAAGPDEPDPYKSDVPAPDSLAGWSAFPVSAELVRQVSADESDSRPYPDVAERSDAQPAVRPDSVSRVDAAVRPRPRSRSSRLAGAAGAPGRIDGRGVGILGIAAGGRGTPGTAPA